MRAAAFVLVFLVCMLGCSCTTAQNIFKFNTSSQEIRDEEEDGRIRAVRSREDKDFVFGGLFPIHADAPNSLGARCGEVRQERGLERMEAMLFALDKINSDPTILPDLEIGYDIRDTCNSETIGLDEAIDLIITGSNLNIESCESVLANSTNGTASVPTSGIIGAASSRVSVPVASLGRLFRMPQVSYASSSALLNDRERYGYFQRTIPPDSLQATAMVDILKRFGWNYVSVVFSQDTYGGPGIDEFRAEAKREGICIGVDRGIPTSFTDKDYDQLVSDLGSTEPRVVIVFANQETVEELLSRIRDNETLRSNFTWIASDAWARSIDLVHKFNETASGLFGVAPHSDHYQEFQDYFSQLTIDSNIRNNWFPEFFSAFANCSLEANDSDGCDTTKNVTSFSRYQQGNFIPLVIDAVYAMAHGLHDFLTDNCNATADKPYVWFRENGSCFGQSRQLNGSSLLEYIMNTNFTSITGTSIGFDNSGNVKGRYEILQYQAQDTDNGRTYSFKSIGTWENISIGPMNETEGGLNITEDDLQFGLTANGSIRYSPTESQCGMCEPGHFVRDVGSCCRICEPCVGNKYSSERFAKECLNCSNKAPNEMWGNNKMSLYQSCLSVTVTLYGVKHKVNYTPRFVSPTWLVTFTVILVAIQMSLVIISLAFNHPTVERTRRLDDDNDLALPDIVITCKEEYIAIIILSIVYETALIGVATALGVFSFKYPENFNEEKYISFCTFALLIVWIGLIPTYFTTKFRQEYQNAAISFFVLLSAYAMHIFIFGPKLYIVIFQPQRNTTHYSTHHTASAVDGKETGDLQMHGGSYKDGM